MANEQNLQPFSMMDKDRLREISRRGGVASGAARRQKRDRINEAKINRAADEALFREGLAMISTVSKLVAEYRTLKGGQRR